LRHKTLLPQSLAREIPEEIGTLNALRYA